MAFKDPEKRRAYHREYQRNRWANDPEFRKKVNERQKKYREQKKDRLLKEFHKDGCKYCGETEPCCLDAHHRDPNEKEFSVARLIAALHDDEKIKAELAKCDCVCANCHRKIHAGIMGVKH